VRLGYDPSPVPARRFSRGRIDVESMSGSGHHRMTRAHRRGRGAITAAALGLALGLCVAGIGAQGSYPRKVVTLLTHSSVGGGSDVFLREMVPHLSRVLGATIVVENVTGGSGARALAAVASARPNGSTFYATTPTFIYTSLMSRVAADYKDVEPLVNVFYDPEVLYTAADSRFKTLQDVVAAARSGRSRWGAANPASLERQTLERVKQRAGVTPIVATFEGGGDLLVNVLNHTLDMGIGELQELRAQLDARKVRLLAVVGDSRLAQYPDVPTAKEQRVDVSVRKFRGLAGPKGTPPAVVAAWEAAIPRLLGDAAYTKVYTRNGLEPGFIPHAAYGRFIADFAADTEAFLRTAGMRR
jgi:putative tricarboxylic transport membrane protein